MSASGVVLLGRFARAFAGARGNDRLPRTRPLATLTTAWAAALSLSPSSVPSPSTDKDSGMIPWLSWAALLAERDLGRALTPSPTAPALPASDPRLKLWQREWAAKILADAPALALTDVEVAVRRVEPGRSLLTLTLDRATADGRFVRVVVDAWVDVKAAGGVLVDGDRATASQALREVLSLSSQLPAPALLVRAAALPGVVVERLTRGVLGPAIHSERRAGFDLNDDDFGLVVSREEVAEDVAATADNDLFADDDLARVVAALPPPLRHFRCFRDAKVVATSTLSAQVTRRAQQRQTKTVVWPLR